MNEKKMATKCPSRKLQMITFNIQSKHYYVNSIHIQISINNLPRGNISVPLLYIDFMRIKIYTNAVIKGGYEPTTVPITLGRERSCYTNIGFKYIYRHIYEHDCRTFEDTKEATRTVN